MANYGNTASGIYFSDGTDNVYIDAIQLQMMAIRKTPTEHLSARTSYSEQTGEGLMGVELIGDLNDVTQANRTIIKRLFDKWTVREDIDPISFYADGWNWDDSGNNLRTYLKGYPMRAFITVTNKSDYKINISFEESES